MSSDAESVVPAAPLPPARKRKFRLDEIGQIISQFKMLTQVQKLGVYEACGQIATDYGRSQGVIYALVRRFLPSTDAADAYLKSNSLKLAMRVVRKANVTEAIDVLSRSNIGVLAPKQEAGGGQGGFFLSVQADTCGAVKIGITSGQGASEPQDDPLTPPSEPLRGSSGYALDIGERVDVFDTVEVSDAIGGEGGNTHILPGVPHPNQGRIGRFSKPEAEWSQRAQIAAEQARKRIKEARIKAQGAKFRDLEV